MSRRRPAAVAVLIGLLTLCPGCGVPTTVHVERIAPTSVPFGLLDSSPPGVSTARRIGPSTQVFFVKHARLVPVARHVFGDNVPAEAVRLLLAGPTADEATGGLASDIPNQTRLISLDVKGPIATVDLSSEFGTIGGSEQVLAVAQIVYTLTASPYIDAVAFAINGKRTAVPDGSGSLAATPRTRHDYRQLAPAH